MAELNTKCFFRNDEGEFCKRWAQRGSRFCYNHQPQGEGGPGIGYGSGHSAGDWPQLHPHARLATLSDLFDLVRETLNATRMGTVTPGQAAAVGSLAALWLKLYEKLRHEERLYALSAQIIPTLVDAESAAELERVQRHSDENGHQMALEEKLDHIVRFGSPDAVVPSHPGSPDASESPARHPAEAATKAPAEVPAVAQASGAGVR